MTVSDRQNWRRATVMWSRYEASDMVSLAIRPERWIPHRAGQYYDVRFPEERVVRAFSVVSSPTVTDHLEFGIQVLPRGLLSPRLAAVLPGTAVEIRGPVGRFFTWSPDMPGRLVLIGAGAGITPLLSMYDHAVTAGEDHALPPIFLLSARSPEKVFRYQRYHPVLVTRYSGAEGRIDRAFLAKNLGVILRGGGSRDGRFPDGVPPQVRICGPPGFAGDVVEHLLTMGIPETAIRSEVFV